MAMLHKENIYSHITVCNIMQAAPVPIVLMLNSFIINSSNTISSSNVRYD